MHLCVHIIVDNIMTCVFKSTVLNCKYFGSFCMNLFQTWIYCTKFCVVPFSYLLRRPCRINKSNSTQTSSILVQICVHIITVNIMMHVLLPEKYESIFDVSSKGPFQVEAYLTYCEDIHEVSTYTGSCCFEKYSTKL